MPMEPFFKCGAIFYCINDPTVVLVWIFVYWVFLQNCSPVHRTAPHGPGFPISNTTGGHISCSYTGHNASLQLSTSTRHCSTGRPQTNTHYQPAPGLCSPVAVPIWLGDQLGGVKGQDVQNNDALCMSRAPFQTHSSISIHSTFTRSLGWRQLQTIYRWRNWGPPDELAYWRQHRKSAQTRTRKVQRCASFEIMICTGDTRRPVVVLISIHTFKIFQHLPCARCTSGF